MLAPKVQARMEEPDNLSGRWLRARDVRTLMPVAMKTGEREIPGNRLAPMLKCDDVIGMKGQRIRCRGKVTILAPVFGTLPALPDQFPIHEWRRSAGFAFRASRALDCITASRFPTCR